MVILQILQHSFLRRVLPLDFLINSDFSIISGMQHYYIVMCGYHDTYKVLWAFVH